MNDSVSLARRACDMAASAVFPASLVSADYVSYNAAGEPYLMKCAAQSNKIILFLHTWSADCTQIQGFPEIGGIERACIVAPNFNGPNSSPTALGSDDSLGRIDTVLQEVQCKTGLARIYVVAASGGSMAALNYMGKYPGKVHRASLWLPIHDLATLYTSTQDQQLKDDMLAVIGHAPCCPDEAAYRLRSPRERLQAAEGPCTVFLNVGTADTVAPSGQAIGARDQLQGRPGMEVVYREWPIGHEFGAAQRTEAVKQLVLE